MNEISVQAPSSGRAAYSVVPNPDEPVILQLDGNLARVLEISAVGFSAPSDAAKPELNCRFVDLGADHVDALHHYVLVRQKEVIRALRAGSSLAAPG